MVSVKSYTVSLPVSGNNGSAFAGLGANSLWYNVLIGLAMLIGRFAVIVPVLAIAGNMATKKIAPANAGTFNTAAVFLPCFWPVLF